MPLLQSVKEFMLNFPSLDVDAALLSDHSSGEILQYSIVQQPGNRIISEDIIGNKECQYNFAFQSIESTMDEGQRLLNAEFYEKLEKWFTAQTEAGDFPVLETKQFPDEIKVVTSGYLMQEQTGTGVYQVQCVLLYTQKI